MTVNARFNGAAVEGELEMYETPLALAVCSLLDALLEQGAEAPDVGLSIVFEPVWEHEGRAPLDGRRVICGIRHVESVDLVFQPAADGRVLAALSAASASTTISAQRSTPAPPITAANEPTTQQTDLSNQIQEEKSKMETQKPGNFAADQNEPAVTAGDRTALGEAVVEQASTWLHAISAAGQEALLAASGLPQASKQRLAAQSFPDPQTLQNAIEAERSYLAALSADQVIKIGGQPPRLSGAVAHGAITGTRDGLDRLSLALDALVGGVRPPDGIQPLTGIREAYHLLSGDYEMNGVFQPERVMFANVTSSTMAALVANALNKRLANEFQQYPQWWSPIVSSEDFASLQDVRWITLGGVGELPTVAEGAAYTELTWDDKTETAAFVKKGGYLGITLEAIDKDDVGRLRAAPRALAQAAWLTLSKAISSIFTSNSGVGPTMSDGLALFHTSHGNLGTAALSRPNFDAVRTAMRKQTELNSGERLGSLTLPRYLLVPPDLELTAMEVLASEKNYSYALSNGVAAPDNMLTEGDSLTARMAFARSRVIVVDLWTSASAWAAVADPNLFPTIGLGFRYGRAPEIFSVASPTAGLMFTNDTMPVKTRFFFAVGPIDWKGLFKANV